ncbi:hypothetical protein GCM10020366_08530 [Saccharopolyspora gregorii]|uniref:Uncharacterized protein n=1 Tax=Saccharopolyspora gregorii TaxID=33914 RepID=A0ABP6RIY6_9PSEU
MPPCAETAFCRAEANGSSGLGERDPVHHHELQRIPGHVHPLPQRQGSEQGRRRVGGELGDELRRVVLALAQHRRAEPPPQFLGRLPRGPHRGEQPEGAAPGGLDEFGELVEVFRRQPVPPGLGQVPGDVEDPAALVLERRADVQPRPLRATGVGRHLLAAGHARGGGGRALGRQPPLPGEGVEGPAERQRRRGEHRRALPEQPFPQQPADAERRDLHRGRPVRFGGDPHHVAALPLRLVEGVEQPHRVVVHLLGDGERELAGAAAVRVLLALRPERGGAGGRGVAQRGERTAERFGHLLQPLRPGVGEDDLQPFGGLVEPVGDALVDGTPAAPRGELRLVRRQLAGRGGGDPVDEVVRLVDHDDVVLWQHRPVVEGVDGQQGVVGDDDVGAPRLTAGPFGEAVGADGQRCTPRHSFAVTDSCRHAWSVTPGTSSSRSPVSVSVAHSRTRLTWRSSAEAANGSNSAPSSGSAGAPPSTRFRHR